MQPGFDLADEFFKVTGTNLGECAFNRFEKCLSDAVLGGASQRFQRWAHDHPCGPDTRKWRDRKQIDAQAYPVERVSPIGIVTLGQLYDVANGICCSKDGPGYRENFANRNDGPPVDNVSCEVR